MARVLELEGVDELRRVLKRLPTNVQAKVLDQALSAGGALIAREARKLVPVRSGALKKSITNRKKRARRRRDLAERVIGFRSPTSRIAHLVEFGTAHSKAQPFMRPAVDARGTDAVKLIGERLARAIEKAAQREAGQIRPRRR